MYKLTEEDLADPQSDRKKRLHEFTCLILNLILKHERKMDGHRMEWSWSVNGVREKLIKSRFLQTIGGPTTVTTSDNNS